MYVVLTIVAVYTLFPIYFLFVNSFKSQKEINRCIADLPSFKLGSDFPEECGGADQTGRICDQYIGDHTCGGGSHCSDLVYDRMDDGPQ